MLEINYSCTLIPFGLEELAASTASHFEDSPVLSASLALSSSGGGGSRSDGGGGGASSPFPTLID